MSGYVFSDAPKTGWLWCGEIDNGHDDQICEWCNKAHIRFVHYMNHPHFAENRDLMVGCCCAEKMAAAPGVPTTAEKFARSKLRDGYTWDSNGRTHKMLYNNADGHSVGIMHISNGACWAWCDDEWIGPMPPDVIIAKGELVKLFVSHIDKPKRKRSMNTARVWCRWKLEKLM